MRLVILESPYAGDVRANEIYARACVRDSLGRGEAPIASHLLYTQPGILDDDIAHERQWGIDAGLAWRAVAQASCVYEDFGVSKGMEYGIAAAKSAGIPIERRKLSPELMRSVTEDVESLKNPEDRAEAAVSRVRDAAESFGRHDRSERRRFLRDVQFGIEAIPGSDVSFTTVNPSDMSEGLTDIQALQDAVLKGSAVAPFSAEGSLKAESYCRQRLVSVSFETDGQDLDREDLTLDVGGERAVPVMLVDGQAFYDLPDATAEDMEQALENASWIHNGFSGPRI